MTGVRYAWILALTILVSETMVSRAMAGDRSSIGNGPSECTDPFEGEDLQFDPRGWKTDFCRHEVPFAEFRSGGPPRDGIPPIDNPVFVDVEQAEPWLDEREPVIALEVGLVSRAYPLQILMFHEVVNDSLAGVPVAVTFCPLCYTALVFERPDVDGRTLTFGVSGNLRHSDMVLWDRQTESWWQQFSGRALVGRMTGRSLKRVPSAIVSWAAFKERHPEGRVLSRDTGHKRPYGKNPYAGYDDVDRQPFMYTGAVDDRHPPMTRVVGVLIGEIRKAYSTESTDEQTGTDRQGWRSLLRHLLERGRCIRCERIRRGKRSRHRRDRRLPRGPGSGGRVHGAGERPIRRQGHRQRMGHDGDRRLGPPEGKSARAAAPLRHLLVCLERV